MHCACNNVHLNSVFCLILNIILTQCSKLGIIHYVNEHCWNLKNRNLISFLWLTFSNVTPLVYCFVVYNLVWAGCGFSHMQSINHNAWWKAGDCHRADYMYIKLHCEICYITCTSNLSVRTSRFLFNTSYGGTKTSRLPVDYMYVQL